MRRMLLIASCLLFLGVARAQEPAETTAEETVVEKRPFDSTFTFAPLWLAIPPFTDESVPVLEIAGEIRLAERHSGQLIVGFGWRDVEDLGVVLRVHIGGEYRFYMLGTQERGLYAAVELMREELSQARIVRVTTVGVLAGYKLPVWKGLTVDLGLGGGSRFQPDVGSEFTAIVNLSIGFSTRIQRND